MTNARLLLVDGSNLLFQMFYGMPARIMGKHGKPIHGTLGFVGALLKLIRKFSPTHTVVLFDGERHLERKEIDPDYKANRPDFSQMPEEETPFSQLPDIFNALTYLKIPYAETTVCETDDVIAAYAFRYNEETEIFISSFDSDFYQLVKKNVYVLRYRGDNTLVCDENYIREKLGVFPWQYADFKCLTGDKADNIKGVEKIGQKTAAALLNEFGSLENLLLNGERITKPHVKDAVRAARERLLTNAKLIRLKDGAPLPFTLKQLRYAYQGQKTGDVLAAIGIK